MSVDFEFWLERSNELFVESDLTKRTILLTSTPNKDTLAVEVVANVARQRNNRLSGFELFNTKGALAVRREPLFVISTFIEVQDAHFEASSSLFLSLLLRESLTFPRFARLSLCVKSGKSLISDLLLFPLLLF